MPLIEPRGTGFALFRRYVRWKMELFVIDALDFEAWREAEVAFWDRATSKNMDLGLHRDCWTLGNAVEVDAVVVGEKRVVAVSKTTGCFFAIETGTKLDQVRTSASSDLLCSEKILLLRLQHLRLLLEHQQFPLVQSIGNELKVCIREVVQIDAVDLGAKVYLATFRVLDGHDASGGRIGMWEIEHGLLCFETQTVGLFGYDCCNDHGVEYLDRE